MNRKKVAVAMSGGVDSSAAAALLIEQGYEVFGVTMLVNPVFPIQNLFFPDDDEEEKVYESAQFACRALTKEGSLSVGAVTDAASVCSHLEIKHYVIDVRKKFREKIVDHFAEQYYNGVTPNPCVICNPTIKFGTLLDTCLSLGADFMATGHYVRVRFNEKTGKYEILRGVDGRKDQAYALYSLTQEQLSKVIFPLGEMYKGEVRKRAEEMGVPTAQSPESQDICFTSDDNYSDFLQQHYPKKSKPGPIVHVNGEILGEHRGLIHYTVGQRKRLGVSHPKALYVVKIDSDNNRLLVGYWEDLFTREVRVKDLHWISGSPPEKNRVLCKIRYNTSAAPAVLELDEKDPSRCKVIFDEKVRAVTPGQSAVFYSFPRGEIVPGGGIIER